MSDGTRPRPRPRNPGGLKRDLQSPDRELIETHISWVFRSPTEVWKVKKPVSLGFLDFTTVARRRAACEAEVRLNRRLAPHVYLGVVPVTRDRRGVHRLGGRGEPVDWAVHMNRLPDRNRADVRLAEGRLSRDDVLELARCIARFHADAPAGDAIARYGSAAAIGVNVRENFAQTRDTIQSHLTAAEFAEIETGQLGFLESHDDAIERRVRTGKVRDGHGDLRLEHVYIDDHGGTTILDCIEFNERFRFADVCADIAFLSMDFAWHGRVDLAEDLLAAYAREANDYDLYALVDFYEGYRAFVRGKVASILASDEEAGSAARERAAEDARRYYLLALAHEKRSLMPPVVVAVGGVIGAGKTTIAEHIASALSAPTVSSDWTRKDLLGVAPTQPLRVPAWTGPYDAATTEGVYAELLRRADTVVASGRSVIMDASFNTKAHRAAARQLARRRNVTFMFVECRADAERCRERLRRRDTERGVTDGRLEIFDEFAARWETVDELAGDEHLVLDTAQPLEASHRVLRERLPFWPAGMTA